MKPLSRNNLGKKYLVEDCQKIRIDKVVKKAKEDLIDTLIRGQAEVDGFVVNITSHRLHHGGKRLWFECPLCELPCGIIYRHPTNRLVGCRLCLELEYKSRRYKGMIENSEKM